MPEWSTACPDWADRLRTGRSIIPPPIFPKQAARALEVFKSLKIVDAAGSPTFGEACREWVFEFVASIFGAYDEESGKRLITEWFLLVSKKNSKSTIAAGIMMTALVLNWREAAGFAVLAPTKEVADNCFMPARQMCGELVDPELHALMHVQAYTRHIKHRTKNATLKVVAADSASVSGMKSVGTLVDELWIFGKQADAENMLREATGGLASRDEGFTIYLTTQSDEPPAGVFLQKLRYARNVRDGKIHDPAFVPILYEFPEDMIKSGEYLKPKHWHIPNPNMGYSVSPDFLEREYKKAAEAGQESLRGFFAKHLDVEIGLALMSDRWAGAEFWEGACDASLRELDAMLDKCEVAVIGIDGGGLDDLLGLVVMGRERAADDDAVPPMVDDEGSVIPPGRWLLWAHGWAHPIVLERHKDIAPALRDFANDGDLTFVQRPGDDVRAVAEICTRVRDRGLLPPKEAVGVDAAGIGDIVDVLTSPECGFTMEQIVAVSQGWRLNGAIKTTERKLAGGTLLVTDSRFMKWCVGNAKVVAAGNAITITKQISGSAKIDPLMAAFDASTLMARNPQPQTGQLAFFA